jgi:hypothetical protein
MVFRREGFAVIIILMLSVGSFGNSVFFKIKFFKKSETVMFPAKLVSGLHLLE